MLASPAPRVSLVTGSARGLGRAARDSVDANARTLRSHDAKHRGSRLLGTIVQEPGASGLRRAAAASDGVIHTAFIHDFSKLASSVDTDKVAATCGGARRHRCV
jgi:hypothetical protein